MNTGTTKIIIEYIFKSHDFDDLVEEWMDEHFEEHPDLSDNELRELAEKN